MKNYCTLYTHEVHSPQLVKEIESLFPKGKITTRTENGFNVIHVKSKSGLFGPKKEFQISTRERETPSFELTTTNSPITENLAGMMGFVGQLPCENPTVKDLLLKKIGTINSETIIMSNGDLNVELGSFVKGLSKKYNALLFVSPSSHIAQSDSQHFLNADLNLVLDISGNSKVDTLDVSINAAYFDNANTELEEDQTTRKKASESVLEKSQLKINRNLPCIESEKETTIRSFQEIVDRLNVLSVINLFAFNNINSEQGLEMLNKFGLYYKASPNEIELLTNPTEEAKMRETWKCEAILVLLWALKVIPELPFPNQMADLNGIPRDQYPILIDENSLLSLNTYTENRSAAEILDTNDLYYRIHWACVDARINQIQMDTVNSGVAYERHYALNWLINYRDQDWDNVSCDT